jgi:peptidoglycan/xylan/chitin deacetylase (PgdA/CDA1 family)
MTEPVPILMYHRLGKVRKKSVAPGHYVQSSQFAGHLRLIKALKRTPITLAELREGFLAKKPLPPKALVITFDDGYKSFFTLGLPHLEKHSFSATVFLVSACVGRRNEWDMKIGDVEEELMSRDEVLSAQAKRIEFGSHTVNHANLSLIDRDQAVMEIGQSKSDLESWLGKPVDFFCYPYGGQNPEVRELVKCAGYKGATSVVKGVNVPETDPFGWGRINVRATTSNFQLALKLWRTKKVL